MANGSVRFVGTHEHSLDVKGRITLPARFRNIFGDSCVLARSQFSDLCLVIWREEDFRAYSDELLTQDLRDDSVRRRVRIWSSEAFDAEIDASGRIALPLRLRNYAQLTREVSIVGALETVELWSVENWQRFRGAEDA